MYDHLPEKALSIRQPWAWAIVNGGKDVENRDWKTGYRGPICIHAAKRGDNTIGDEMMTFIQMEALRLNGSHPPLSPHLGYGGIIGVAEIVDCVETSDSPWFFGRYGFVLRNARPVEFIPVKGVLSLFDWRKNLADQSEIKSPDVAEGGVG
jgi:hypothetical protein